MKIIIDKNYITNKYDMVFIYPDNSGSSVFRIMDLKSIDDGLTQYEIDIDKNMLEEFIRFLRRGLNTPSVNWSEKRGISIPVDTSGPKD